MNCVSYVLRRCPQLRFFRLSLLTTTGKIVIEGIRRFLHAIFITLYYVNAGSLVCEGHVVCLFSQHDRSGAVREKEIKNELGCISAKQRFANYFTYKHAQ